MQLVQSNAAVAVRSTTITTSKDPAEHPLIKQRSNQAVNSDHDSIKLKRKKKGNLIVYLNFFFILIKKYFFRRRDMV